MKLTIQDYIEGKHKPQDEEFYPVEAIEFSSIEDFALSLLQEYLHTTDVLNGWCGHGSANVQELARVWHEELLRLKGARNS